MTTAPTTHRRLPLDDVHGYVVSGLWAVERGMPVQWRDACAVAQLAAKIFRFWGNCTENDVENCNPPRVMGIRRCVLLV